MLNFKAQVNKPFPEIKDEANQKQGKRI